MSKGSSPFGSTSRIDSSGGGRGTVANMNVVAVVIALVAVLIFLLAHFGAATKLASIPLGLVFLTVALIVQFVWLDHQWIVGPHHP